MLWLLPALVVFAVASVWLSVVDVREHRLPNQVTLPLLPVLIALLALASLGTGEFSSLWRALLAAAVLFVVYFVLNLVYPAGLGMGDVKLAPSIGAMLGWLSWSAVLWGSLFALFSMGVLSLVLIVLRRATMKTALPFGPFMFAGAWIAIGFAYLGLL